MRIIPAAEKYEAEAAVLGCATAVAAMPRRKDDEEKFGRLRFRQDTDRYDLERDSKVVCVTSGLTFLGRAVVDRLLIHGYTVRIVVDNRDDIERMRETMDETAAFKGRIEAVTAKLTEVESLVDAFDGCNGVFHTSGLVDPSGASGYSKCMVEVEAKASENVMEACTRTESVRKCVMTSSILACLWPKNGTQSQLPSVIDHSCWSDESLCKDKKLWYACGKLKAEKNAWKIAEANKGFRLSTICPALITGPHLLHQNPTPTIAYLKGAQEMYAKGVLATVDVRTLAKAHVRVYEAMMNKAVFGRYICFDRVITTEYEAEELARQTGLSLQKIRGDKYGDSTTPFTLSDRKLLALLSTSPMSCLHEI